MTFSTFKIASLSVVCSQRQNATEVCVQVFTAGDNLRADFQCPQRMVPQPFQAIFTRSFCVQTTASTARLRSNVQLFDVARMKLW